ncbi:MAG: N-acetylneuraminate synthase [Lentisphaerae bacterium GWF2_52_8]|nr:MAG: N-acetylneuraminate synthase [Lentisphaerae bacterium GWF2_52_8]
MKAAKKEKIFIVAEAGVNHNGSAELALKLSDAAKEAGADAVKFQTWQTELVVTRTSRLAPYQANNLGRRNGSTQFKMLKNLELTYDEFRHLKHYCDQLGIMFLSTPDELTSAHFLRELQEIFKIGSGELTNLPFLREIASFKKDVILSTGMGNMEEIELALQTLLNGGLKRSQVTLLHAVSSYPAPYEEVNLSAIPKMKKKFRTKVGYSDHTLGISVALAAVALGACIIEKHFTLDRKMPGPDHKASIEPQELTALVTGIRQVEAALGNGTKGPSLSEQDNINLVRKSIVAARPINKGELFSAENLTIKRPGTGLPPSEWDNIVGKRSPCDFREDEPIEL